MMDGSGSGALPSSSASTNTHATRHAVQVNVLGRGGTVGQPMFISTLSGSVRPFNSSSGSGLAPTSTITASSLRPTFRYSVKIITSERPSQHITRQLHHFDGKFTSITAMKVLIMEKMKEHVPDTVHFNVGYYEGRQLKKRWLCCHDDLLSMYQYYKDGEEISLWCDGKRPTSVEDDGEQAERTTCKRKQDSVSRREEKVDSVYTDLKEKHRDKYDNPKLRLWARMIATGIHDSTEEPPAVPAFQSGEPKRKKRESISNVLTGAVEAIAKSGKTAQTPPTNISQQESHSTTQVGISPGKTADLRMKNLQQLCYLQTLYEDKILSDQELAEQKAMILNALRQLS